MSWRGMGKRGVAKWLARAASGLVLLVASPAGSFPHVVQKGETVAQIAETMYGRVELERVIVSANGLDGRQGSEIVVGMRLEIPAVSFRKVLPGDTWESLAALLLGDSRRGDSLAQLNDAKPWIRPAVGREIVIPFNLRIVAERADTTQSVAYRYLGRRDDAWLIATYNGLKRARLRQGEILLVPLHELSLTPAGQRAAITANELVESEGGGRALEVQRQAEQVLPALARDVRQGRYVDAVVGGAGLLGTDEGSGLTEPQLGALHRLLLEAYVALGAKAQASRACTRWREHDPRAQLDPVTVSPKILAACVGDIKPTGDNPPRDEP